MKETPRYQWEPPSESKFAANLTELAETLGFKVWPVNQTRRKPREYVKRGHADLLMCGHGRILYVETKVDRNQQSEAQKEFERAVTSNGALYWVIRTRDEFLLMGHYQGWWH